MAIIKSKNMESVNLMENVVPEINVEIEENLDSIKFNKDEYLLVLEQAKTEGYNIGFNAGKKEGYDEGIQLLNEDAKLIKNKLDEDILNAKKVLENESVMYIDSFKSDIYGLVEKTINKVFFNAIDNESIMSSYIENLCKHVVLKYKNIKIVANEKTMNLIQKNISSEDATFSLSNTLDDYDVKITSDSEYVEFFLKEEIKKVSELFC